MTGKFNNFNNSNQIIGNNNTISCGGRNESIYLNLQHMKMFYTLLDRCHYINDEVQAVMYLLALATEGNMKQVEQMFDFDEMHIRPENFEQAWQTGGTSRAIRLAFILWNGFPTEEHQEFNGIDCIFGYSSWDRYFLQAIRMRYSATCN